jgi:signal transduction histidine kinase
MKKKFEGMPTPLRELAEKQGLVEQCGTIEKQVEYMNEIVSDLQDYARPVKPKLMEADIHKLISETLSTITVPEGVKVATVVEEGFPKLMLDPTLMKRVFTNLMTNAIQAMPNGGKLTIGASKTDETASISVEDTGVGIPKQNLGKLFQPLFTTKAKGMGLGLAICKRMVEAHGGEITVESKVGKGTIFTVKIPLRREVN